MRGHAHIIVVKDAEMGKRMKSDIQPTKENLHCILSDYKYIPNLASCFAALSQTTLRVSICEGTFDVLVRSPVIVE